MHTSGCATRPGARRTGRRYGWSCRWRCTRPACGRGSTQWQKDYFGLPPNPNAAPAADPDGDGQTNLFEFTAGVIPNDPTPRFTPTVAPVPDQPAQTKVIFIPRLTDRTYAVTFKTDLTAATWTPLPGGIVSDNGQQRTVTDPTEMRVVADEVGTAAIDGAEQKHHVVRAHG